MRALPMVRDIFRLAMKAGCGAPILMLLLQFPLALTEILQEALGINNSLQPSLAAIAIVLPSFFILSFFSSALSFSAVWRIATGKSCNFSGVWADIRPRIGMLILAAITLGSLSGLGLVAYILPGLVLMTVFLFVPHLIVADDPVNLWVYATRSKKLVSKHIYFSFMIVVISFALSTVLYLAGEHLGTYYGGIGSNEDTRLVILVAIRSFFAMLGGLAVDLWVASYFLTLRRDV